MTDAGAAVLPIDPFLPDIAAAVSSTPAVIVKAEPGAGKTTRVPPGLLDAVKGRIVVLEPRRLAARLSAERVAAELGEPVGRTVGYQIRFDSKVTDATRIVFVTEGVFLRLALDAPTLAGIGAVVIDEFHERHIHTDLALALVRRLQAGPRADLRLVVMSATLATGPLADYLPGSRAFEVPGRTFPVAIEYLPFGDDAPVEDSVDAGVRRLLADPRCPGNVLVFLTGLAEIRRCAARLSALRGVDVLPLAADLPAAEQARVFQTGGPRKVVLATNVAETSLTLPGVTGVVDTGRAKIAGHASWSGMPTLDVKKVSQASCIQRSGRAGRTAAGVACRLYSESDFLGRPAFTVPDIRRLDLAETYLDVLALVARGAEGDLPADASGVRATRRPDARQLASVPESRDGVQGASSLDPRRLSLTDALPWFEAPEPKAVESARGLLVMLGALSPDGDLTPLGRRLARIPLHPRLAAIVARGQDQGCAEAALAAACLVSERMLLSRGVSAVTHEESDVGFQLEVLLKTAAGRPLSPRALADAVDPGKARQIRTLYDSLASRLRIGPLARAQGVGAPELAACLLAGFPDRVARRRPPPRPGDAPSPGNRPLYNFCLGRGGFLADGSVVKDAELILALDASETQSRSADRGTAIYVASAVTVDTLLGTPAPGLLDERTETVWADEAERVDVWERLTYGQLVVSETRAPVRAGHAASVSELLRAKLAERWSKPFPDAGDLDAYHERIRLLMARDPSLGFPRFEGEMLELLQAEIAEGKRSFKEIAARSLLAYLEDQLPYELKTKLERDAPLELRLANGRRLKVTYEPGRPPFVTGYIQDFYGLRATPALPGGAAELTVHLTAPNRRPVQVTSDLAGFWQRSYPPLRSELGRNYPRHYWPEDPTTAEPVLHKARVGKT